MTPAVLSSCSEKKEEQPNLHTPEELGMYSFVDVAPDGKPLKAALIGCGDRGTGAAVQFLKAGPNVSIVALADVFADRQEACRKQLLQECDNAVDDDKCFLGFEAYKDVLALPDVDVVLLCTPTHFRPEQFKAAVEAGKHIFMEKPCAIDPTGIRTVIASSRLASSKGLTVITGNQRRHRRDYWEAFVQVKNGLIGDPISASAHWNQGALWCKRRRPGWSDMEYCIRNWFSIKWLSGDHLLDQAIHNIDVATWFMEKHPVKAVGYGGRARRLTGDTFDFFSIDYTYENNGRMLATARQIDGCDGNVSEQIFGTKGIALLGDEIRIVDYAGNELWKYDYVASPVKNPYEQEHVHFIESVRLDKRINQAEELAYSTQTAILGREAAYTGKAITWDEIMASELRYGPETYALGRIPDYKEGDAPVPGRIPDAPAL
jgi:predicted dehydrogenase